MKCLKKCLMSVAKHQATKDCLSLFLALAAMGIGQLMTTIPQHRAGKNAKAQEQIRPLAYVD
jgi:hypothetical protein